jgi:hypothetical protein
MLAVLLIGATSHGDDNSDTPSTSTISSTGAVIRGAGNDHREHSQSDVVIKEKTSRSRKRSRQERRVWVGDDPFVLRAHHG